MRRCDYFNLHIAGALALFSVISKIIFDKVYITSQLVVDEEFHLPLGEAYCRYEFHKWHPKVTTFPGLYLLSSLLFGAFNLCSTYWLRFTSLLCSIINIQLFYYMFHFNDSRDQWKNLMSAINLALLPPLYFFSHLYYTDVASITMLLLLFIASEKGNHYTASIFGLCSILFRQTNIIWITMVFARYALKDLKLIILKNNVKSTALGVTLKELGDLVNILYKNLWGSVKKTTVIFWLNVTCYGSLMVAFVVFVLFNGSIVVGDKTAHEAAIHVPQLFYFSLFCLIFTWSHFIGQVPVFLRFIYTHKVTSCIAVVLGLVLVHFNTLIHPYVLADNRHYVFYIWNRFYGKHVWFRYVVVPVYLFALFVIVKKIWNNRDVTFFVFFIPCTFIVLATQRLLEFRYFFIPYILFRTQLKNVSTQALWCEALSHCVFNYVSFYLFFNKTIQWNDYDFPQRLMW